MESSMMLKLFKKLIKLKENKSRKNDLISRFNNHKYNNKLMINNNNLSIKIKILNKNKLIYRISKVKFVNCCLMIKTINNLISKRKHQIYY